MVLSEPDLREKLRMFLIERLRQFSKHNAPVAVNDVLKTINRDPPNLLQVELALMLLLISPLRTCTFRAKARQSCFQDRKPQTPRYLRSNMKDESLVPTARNETALAMHRMSSETGTEAQYLVHMSRRGELERRGWDYLARL